MQYNTCLVTNENFHHYILQSDEPTYLGLKTLNFEIFGIKNIEFWNMTPSGCKGIETFAFNFKISVSLSMQEIRIGISLHALNSISFIVPL